MALTQEQILQARQKYGVPAQGFGVNPTGVTQTTPAGQGGGWFADAQAQWQQAVPKAPERFKADGVVGAFQDVAQGASKGVQEGLLGLGHFGQKIQKAVGTGLDAVTGDKYDFSGDADQGVFNPANRAAAGIDLEAENTAEKVGKGIEKVAEFAIPGMAANKAEKAVDAATTALPGIWGAAARIAGKSAVQGGAAGAAELVTSGGDAKKAAETAAIAGGTRGVLATIGEGARAMQIPERLYQTIFKNTKADMYAELRSDAFKNMQKTDPKLFERLVKEGIAKADPEGNAVINDTLAERALERGIKGNVTSMANQVVKGAAESELAARDIARSYGEAIDLAEPQYQSVLREIAEEYDNVGFGEVADEAKKLADALAKSEGKVDAMTALQIRRFFDRMRLASSYDKPVSKLSLTQANLKTLADSVRTKVNSIPGMKDVMKDYGTYIDALDAIAQHAKRTGNNQLLGMIDSIFLGIGLGTGQSGALLAGAARKLINIPGIATKAGSAIKNGVMSPGTSAAVDTASSELGER